MHTQTTDLTPWYKQVWPWLLIAIPMSAVVAGITTIVIATQNADSLVNDDYYKEGLAINRNRDKQLMAFGLGIKASLEKQSAQVIQLNLTADASMAGRTITLELSHPTQAEKDIVITRQLDHQHQILINSPVASANNWHVRIYDDQGDWELVGRWVGGKQYQLGQ